MVFIEIAVLKEKYDKIQYSSWHGVHQVLATFAGNLTPSLLHNLPKLRLRSREFLGNITLMSPHKFSIGFKSEEANPLLGQFAGVLRIIVLL